jgi:Protein of unknown function (DUF1572)
MLNEEYIALVVREFERLRVLADRAIAQLPADRFFSAPGEGDNSVAVIVKHVGGNMLSRWRDFLTTDGEKSSRRRDLEFVITPADTREGLLEQWAEGWTALFGALRPLTAPDLGRSVTIRGESLTVLQAINRQITHYPYHVGQIVYLAKHFCGREWKSLSIPVGGSDVFNRNPQKYAGNPVA